MKRKLFVALLFCALMLGLTACGQTAETQPEVIIEETEAEQEIAETEETNETTAENAAKTKQENKRKIKIESVSDYDYATFELTSENLHDGVWDTVITNTANGSNVSPQISWDEVPKAQGYVVYMVDTMAGNWVHWASNNVTETELPQGWAPEGEYIGPYPPSGTHTYEIYVIALMQPVEAIGGTVDASNQRFVRDVTDLDVLPDGTNGNIIAYGHLVGTYTYGD